MAWDSDWSDWFNRSITVYPFVSQNSGGKPTYGDPVTYECFIEDDVKIWKWENADEKQSRRTIYVHCSDRGAIGLKDKIVMPSGYDPRTVFPVYINHHDDESGYNHTEIYV